MFKLFKEFAEYGLRKTIENIALEVTYQPPEPWFSPHNLFIPVRSTGGVHQHKCKHSQALFKPENVSLNSSPDLKVSKESKYVKYVGECEQTDAQDI